MDLPVPGDDLARQIVPAEPVLASGTAERICAPLVPKRKALPHSPFSTSRIEALEAPNSRAVISAICGSDRAASPEARDRTQDRGAGGLPILHRAQLCLQTGILLPEISHQVRGKRG